MGLLRLSPAQATSIHGWGRGLKMTLSWKDIEEKGILFDTLMQCEVRCEKLAELQPDVAKWVSTCQCKPHHAVHMLPWKANPFTDLHGDLADVISLRATSKQLQEMRVTYSQLVHNGMTPETMRLMGLTLQGWIDLEFGAEHMADMTDAQLSRVFCMTRHALKSCFK